ncbi:MAG TPA: hypothetical protein DCG75_16975 [Bacteroidales bacterium]|jgi:hypothetical protein|nr:hypothetical protein [Bacteroidales bacterium]
MTKRKTFIIAIILISLASFISFSFNNTGIPHKNQTKIEKDTVSANPKIDIKVNKEYDDHGNIIRYDSSYTYIYTYPNGNTEELNIDSIFNRFRPFFFNHGSNIIHDPFNSFFDEDTFYQQHFFDDDFFMNQFENEMFHFKEMMHEMDSLRNLFLKDMYPDFKDEPVKPKKEKTKGIEI